ncbi:energy-coupling factor ABC transporter substrate-binding protein [Bacillota bacterium LX-D]|nr:energy-coupling factor ABC transporter substrate-binding protein [Bacillota bacterium LX-D]
MRTVVKNMILIALVVFLAAVPLFVNKSAAFSGADSQAEEAITELQPNYHVWAAPIWEPPSGEVESLLFALQAALGAGLLGYYLGTLRGKVKHKAE